jgi:hypothetical protein
MEKIFLYNHYHNGDVFYSRVLIEKLKNFYQIYYYHNLNTPLFEDMPEVIEIKGIPSDFSSNQSDFNKRRISTWIGQDNFKYLSKINKGCTWENYSFLYDEILHSLNLKPILDDIVLPKIYFDKLRDNEEISSTMTKKKVDYNRIILISNGNVHSGQAVNFEFSSIINQLASEYSDYLFLATQFFDTTLSNILFTKDITKKTTDLLEIGLISTFCNTIIGRASGPYCFSQNETNLLDSEKKIICFSNNYNEGKYYDKMLSKFFWSQTSENSQIINLIKSNII